MVPGVRLQGLCSLIVATFVLEAFTGKGREFNSRCRLFGWVLCQMTFEDRASQFTFGDGSGGRPSQRDRGRAGGGSAAFC